MPKEEEEGGQMLCIRCITWNVSWEMTQGYVARRIVTHALWAAGSRPLLKAASSSPALPWHTHTLV